MKHETIDASNVNAHCDGFVDGCGGFYIRRMEYRAGERHIGHSHFENEAAQ